MHRAVVLTTLVLLLLAVAGVSAARESGIFTGGINNDDPPESTTQEEGKSFEPTMTSALGGASADPTVGQTEKPTATAPGEKTLTLDSNNVGKPAKSGRVVGKPGHGDKVPNLGKPPAEVGHPANGKPEERGNEQDHGRTGSQQKVILCHKDNKTLTVGAPALAAHQRHGDTQGVCQTEGGGSELSGEKMKPEAAKNGGVYNGGQDKVTLCHKNKNTLKVGPQARAAHLRHGDSLGACRPAG